MITKFKFKDNIVPIAYDGSSKSFVHDLLEQDEADRVLKDEKLFKELLHWSLNYGLLIHSSYPTNHVYLPGQRVSGVIIDLCRPTEALKKSSCPAPDYLEEDYMEWNNCEEVDWTNDKIDQLELLTKEYMSGRDDGKQFFFSDQPEAVNAIAKTFPTFELVEVLSEHFPYDYDYRSLRHLKEVTATLELHQEWLSSGGAKGVQADFSGRDFSYAKFSVEVEDLSFEKVIFRGVNLYAADFIGIKLPEADFADAIMCGTSLCGCDLKDTIFTNADLRHAEVSYSSLDEKALVTAVTKGLTIQDHNGFKTMP